MSPMDCKFYHTASGKKKTPRHSTIEMSNLNESKYNFAHLISSKLLKWIPNFVDKYRFLAELLIVEYR